MDERYEQEILMRIRRGETVTVSHFKNGYATCDRNGVPQERTKLSHPYCYDPFLTGRWGPNYKCNAVDWTDRLRQANYDKYDRLAKKHFKDRGAGFRSPIRSEVEGFLREYHDDPSIELITIEEHCNQATGYPVWMLNYYSDKMKLDDWGWKNVEALLNMRMKGKSLDMEKRQHLEYAKFDDAERYNEIEKRLKDAKNEP